MYPAEWLRRRGSKCPFSAPQPLREIFSSPRGKWLNPLPPTHFPSPTSTTLCHRARGCAGRCTTPGSGHIAFPTPQGVVPFVPGGVRYQRAEWDRVRGCARGVHPAYVSHIHVIHTPHMPPIRTIGTTPSGLFMSLAFTRGSASAAQPRALWQNPVGIPGGGWGKARPWGFPEGKRPRAQPPGIPGWGRRLGHRVTTG